MNYLKQLEQKDNSHVEEESDSRDNYENPKVILIHDESSDVEEFILVASRKKRRQNNKSVKMSAEKIKNRQDQGHLGKQKTKGRKSCIASRTKTSRPKKNS
jgi:hypothetical protein